MGVWHDNSTIDKGNARLVRCDIGGLIMRSEIKAIIVRLEQIRDKVDVFMSNAEDRGNDDKVDQLSNELDQIDAAIDILESIE